MGISSNRRDFIKQVGMGAAVTVLGKQSIASLSAEREPNSNVSKLPKANESNEKRPNILYIMTDQQPISCVGAYGNTLIKTPNLDKLAADSVLFERSYIAGFPCCPSRACQFTGRYVHHHRIINNDFVLDPEIPSLGDICKGAGYRTAYFGKWHLGGWMNRGGLCGGNAKGYTEWHFHLRETPNGWTGEPFDWGAGEDYTQHGFDNWAGGCKQYRHWLTDNGLGDVVTQNPDIGCHNILPPGPYLMIGTSKMDQHHHVEAFIAEKAEKFIKANASGRKPWCMVASFYGPHTPVAPCKPWDTMYSMNQVNLPDNYHDTLEGKPAIQKQPELYLLGKWTDEQFKNYIGKYWGTVSYIDLQIGRILDTLEKTGQKDNTIVVFTSDHGEMCGGHGMREKLLFNGYEELFKVPTMIRIPKVTKPSRTDALVSNIDILPTLLEACGLESEAHILDCPENIDGRSLMPLLRNEKKTHRDVIFCEDSSSYICRDEQYKFALHWKSALDELYDLKNDPGEMKNLAYKKEGKAIADSMRQRILAWLKETNYKYVSIVEKQALNPSRGELR